MCFVHCLLPWTCSFVASHKQRAASHIVLEIMFPAHVVIPHALTCHLKQGWPKLIRHIFGIWILNDCEEVRLDGVLRTSVKKIIPK